MRQRISCAVVLMLVVLSGCAANTQRTDAPERYGNLRFAFSADIPPGWQRRETLPALISNERRAKPPPDFDGVIFYNRTTQGVIVTIGSLSDVTWSELPANCRSQCAKELAATLIDAILAKLAPDPAHFKRYDENIEVTRKNWRQSKSSFKPEGLARFYIAGSDKSNYPLQYFEVTAYPCARKRNCVLIFLPYSKRPSYDEDMAAFQTFLSSIRAHTE